MAGLYIEDKYYEATLDDGSVVHTRTKYVVNALKHYRSECFKIIETGEKSIKETPRLMVVTSFEEAMQKMDKITDTQVRIRKARKMIEDIDEIFRKLASGSPPAEQSK